MQTRLGEELGQVLEVAVRLVRQLSSAHELGTAAASVLARLQRQGPRRLTDLATVEGLSQPGMTQLVSRLERDGLAVRRPSASDRRVVLVDLTGEGRAVLAARRAQRAAALDALLVTLPADDRAAIAAALEPLRRLAAAAGVTVPLSPSPARAERAPAEPPPTQPAPIPPAPTPPAPTSRAPTPPAPTQPAPTEGAA